MRSKELFIAYNALLYVSTVLAKFGLDSVTIDELNYVIRELEKELEKYDR